MTTMELRADIFENLNFLLDNEEAMTQLKKYPVSYTHLTLPTT